MRISTARSRHTEGLRHACAHPETLHTADRRSADVGALAAALVQPRRSAGWAPAIVLTKSAPAQVLYGDTATAKLSASNSTGQWGYNLSFRDVLPAGASYVADSTSPGNAGQPTILTNRPPPGRRP